MTPIQLSPAELNRQAVGILCRELGVANTVRFLGLLREGQGDYTAEREALFAGKTVDDISREIEAWKSEQSPSPETIATTESGAGGR